LTANKTLPQFLLVSFLVLVFISSGFLFNGNLTSHDIEEQSVNADTGPLSIILMIGDGMGYEQVELARLVEVGVNGSLYMQQFMWNASVATFNKLGDITDSAAAGTALATGYKTTYGRLGLLPNDAILENIVEFSQDLNKSTGIVSTCRMVDATPAAFSTHVTSRRDYGIIASQIVNDANIDVLLAGGDYYFSSSQENSMASQGYEVVKNREDMLNVTSGKIFGLFAPEHIDYEIDRDYHTTPSIAEMTNKSIELLSQDSDGFFLMVEGGKIDLACHDENVVNTALETIEFDKAVEIALDYVETHSNTILIVTADHETEGLVVTNSDLNETLPSDVLTQAENEAIRVARVNNITVEWTANYHTMTPVPLYCYGSAFTPLPENITIDNTQVFTLMKDFLLGNPLDVTDEITPIWSEIPSDQEITEGESFSYLVTAVDASDIEEYAVNDTMNFAISSTGLITNMTSLVVGPYGLNVSVWDVHGNTAFREITITVLAEITTTTTITTTDITNTTTTSGTGTQTGFELDPMTLTIVGVGAAVVVIVMLIGVKKR